MLMIWASGLNPDMPLIKELCEALSAVDKKAVAGIQIQIRFFITVVIRSLPQQTPRAVKISFIQR